MKNQFGRRLIVFSFLEASWHEAAPFLYDGRRWPGRCWPSRRKLLPAQDFGCWQAWTNIVYMRARTLNNVSAAAELGAWQASVLEMMSVGKVLIATGLALAAIGVVVWGLGRLGITRLPGDIHYQSDGVRIYIPVVTCLAVSLLLTALIWLWQWLGRR
jgi:hypothetical protein